MKIEALKVLDVQRIGDMDDGVKAGIDESSLPFVFELVSKQLYSNPIGSVVREITSNCFDSHVEAGVDEPVIISKTYDQEEGYSIEFKDVGMGISPSRMDDIFMKWFSSTKRGDNTQIGGFGIGSKTPLAYADMFYITTIYNNKEYSYLLHKGENKPTLESLHGYDVIEEEYEYWSEESEEIGEPEIRYREIRMPIGVDTEDHNGTTIKINIANSKDDPRISDVKKFEAELKFQLSYFDNVYFKDWGISNDYDIYEGKYFKFRSDISQSSNGIHLCVGKVRYPIDVGRVSIHKACASMPIAIKFEIGELQVTPSREAIRYDDKSIKLIQERVTLATEELIAIFEKQNPVIETLKEYEKLRVGTPRITFDKEKNHILNMWNYSGADKGFRFAPLEPLNLKSLPDNLFFMWNIVGNVSHDGSIRSSYKSVNNDFVIQCNYVVIEKGEKLSRYTNLYIHSLYPDISIIERSKLDYDAITRKLNISASKAVGKAKMIRSYINVVDDILKTKGLKYVDLKPSDEWVAKYKRSVIESTAAYMRRKNKMLFVRDIRYGGQGAEISALDLQTRAGILIYGFKEDKNILESIYHIISQSRPSIRKGEPKSFMVIQIAKSIEPDILGGKKTIYWKDLFSKKFFRRIETAIEIRKRLDEYGIHDIESYEKYIRGFKEDLDTVRDSMRGFTATRNNNLLLYAKDYYTEGNFIESMLIPVNRFTAKYKFIPKLPLEKHINIYRLNEEDEKDYVDFLKFKKIKLRNKFYLKDKRQLEYEENLKKILNEFKCPLTNLLTYNLINNDKDNNSSEE